MTARGARRFGSAGRQPSPGLLAVICLLSTGAFASSCSDVTTDLIVREADEILECRRDADCTLDEGRCNTDVNRCVICLMRSDCPSGQTCSLPSGSCVQDCSVGGCSGAQPVCNASTGLCQACGADSECGSAAPICDVASGRCGECNSLDDCGGEEPFCNLSTGRCVECLTDGHCEEEEERCSSLLGECAIRCAGPGSCPSDDPICDLNVGFCVECTEDDECGSEQSCRSSDCVETLELEATDSP